MHRALFLALCLPFLILQVASQRTPTISYISQEQIKDIGGTVELDCSVQYAHDYPVLWIKVDRTRMVDPLPISTGSSLIIRDSRFSLRYDTASSTYTLQIKDIQETDAGFYQCQVIIAINNKLTAEVELQVRRPPIISDNSTRSLVVSEGQAVKLECYAGGYPPPRISWRRENNAILPTGGSIYRGHILKIPSVSKKDRGTYYCVAENGVGRGARRNIAVEVEFAPVITVPRPRLGQALQYDMDLECHVEAYPPPALVWRKDGVQLSNNQHYSISHFATADEFTDTTLRVITIEKRQYGKYICSAANKLGTDEKEVELFEKKTKGACFTEVQKDLEEIGILGEDIQRRGSLKKKLQEHQSFQPKPKLKTEKVWVEERKEQHRLRMKENWANIKAPRKQLK